MSKKEILHLLKGTDFFLGVFSADEISKLKIVRYPCLFIVNVVEKKIRVGHWLAIRIDQMHVEIFDSLGFREEKWGISSPNLKSFVNSYRMTHTIIVSPILQSQNSYTCGYYSLFFILFRSAYSFKKLTNYFSSNYALNDERVLQAVFGKINE